eukprot:CAMPEP_0115286228 /NCGR_PEP_ID=MMETSP0270-20121206/61835_1 /TAXON_ID=71861 /ORGANISM="Scrippsiella trochoidea, Strain CCMP3099" /LENGTH=198 /DNA_ID=CAMNT_0002703269 /DNA_START=403 /DNA_END=999 /DNA_ORIENTATION=+
MALCARKWRKSRQDGPGGPTHVHPSMGMPGEGMPSSHVSLGGELTEIRAFQPALRECSKIIEASPLAAVASPRSSGKRSCPRLWGWNCKRVQALSSRGEGPSSRWRLVIRDGELLARFTALCIPDVADGGVSPDNITVSWFVAGKSEPPPTFRNFCMGPTASTAVVVIGVAIVKLRPTHFLKEQTRLAVVLSGQRFPT